jgi:single-strand DNA-binding protein
VNKIIVIGHLGADPEMRYTPNGQSITSFSIASSRRYRTADGEQREETEWFRVSAFGRLADICNQYLSKGRQVYVEGRIKGSAFMGRDGQPRYSLDISANEVQFLGGRGENEYSGGGERAGFGERGGYSGSGNNEPPPYDETDDLPF